MQVDCADAEIVGGGELQGNHRIRCALFVAAGVFDLDYGGLIDAGDDLIFLGGGVREAVCVGGVEVEAERIGEGPISRNGIRFYSLPWYSGGGLGWGEMGVLS